MSSPTIQRLLSDVEDNQLFYIQRGRMSLYMSDDCHSLLDQCANSLGYSTMLEALARLAEPDLFSEAIECLTEIMNGSR